eukprot:TRINITY_DN1176_c0_g1_i2.p1 TRINITY_DN1176_c0_g1~~TRINITY_DN1176_c0_g1_i2.p1  ORF type:complete len:262 (-),score=77.41 TRINITY_DN1176_c0_g1_i2:273-1058(-)
MEDVEAKQLEVVEQFCLLAKNARGRALVELVAQATSHPSLFAFGEILEVTSMQEQLRGSEHSHALDLMELFSYGTWSDYKSSAEKFPPLELQQQLKLKQLTVMKLAETAKVLPYDLLMRELDVGNVRELEDLLINDCMYAGIVRGKLDQRRRCFEVHSAAGRDIQPQQMEAMIQTLGSWLATSDNLLQSIEERIQWADIEGEAQRRHRKEVEERAEEMKRTVNQLQTPELAQGAVLFGDGGVTGIEYVDDSDRGGRPKRRR